MFKSTLVKVATPILCALSIAFTSFASAAPYYGNNNCCQQNDCCDPCQQGNKRGWWKDAAIFVGSAAVGAIAGVAAANSNRHRGRTGAVGPIGPQGVQGVPGIPGAGFTPAVVPPPQPDAGVPVTSLIFNFETTVALVLLSTPGIQAYVTTPDGRTFLGTTFDGLIGSTATVTIPSGPFYVGQYDVGIIMPTGLISLAGLVSVEVSNINGNPATAFNSAGIVVAANLLAFTEAKFFNAQYPFPEVP